VNLGICQGCQCKQYLTVRQRKKGLVIYQILEDQQGKRRYRQVTKIPNSLLSDHHTGNPGSRDGDSLETLARKLCSTADEMLRAVTKSEKCNKDVHA